MLEGSHGVLRSFGSTAPVSDSQRAFEIEEGT